MTILGHFLAPASSRATPCWRNTNLLDQLKAPPDCQNIEPAHQRVLHYRCASLASFRNQAFAANYRHDSSIGPNTTSPLPNKCRAGERLWRKLCHVQDTTRPPRRPQTHWLFREVPRPRIACSVGRDHREVIVGYACVPCRPIRKEETSDRKRRSAKLQAHPRPDLAFHAELRGQSSG